MQRSLGIRIRTILRGQLGSGSTVSLNSASRWNRCNPSQLKCSYVPDRISSFQFSTQSDDLEKILPEKSTASHDNLHQAWRTSAKRSSEIRELLERPIGSWDDETWYKAGKLLIDRFPREAVLFFQLHDAEILQEIQRLFRRLCQERPRTKPTSQLVNTFLSLVRDLIQTQQSAIQKTNHKELLHPSQRSPDMSQLFATEMHSTMQHVTKNRYWHPDTTIAYQAMIQLASLANNPAMAELWLEQQWKKSRDQRSRSVQAPNRYDYTAIVQAWAQSRDPAAADRAALLVRQLQQLYVSGNRDPLLKPTEAAYIGWIVCLTNNTGSNDYPDTAARAAEQVLQEIWYRAETDDFWPSVTVYNAVIRAWAKTGQAEQAEAVLRDLCEKAVKHSHCMPDVTSFTTAIAAWSKSRDPNAPERAERLLRLMQEFAATTGLESVQPNVVTVTAVLNCWAKSNQPHGPARAEAMLRRMQEHATAGNRKLRPNAITYNICMNAWARSGQHDAPERVEALFGDLAYQYQQNRGGGGVRLKPDLVTYMTRINAWERSRNRCPRTAAVQAAAVLQEMVSSLDPTIYPTELHYNRVIAGWTQCGDALQAEAVLERMLDDYQRKGIMQSAPNKFSFHFVMSAWSKQHSRDAAERAEQWLNRMQQLSESTALHVKPNSVSFSTCLGAWARSGAMDAFDRAQVLFQRMKERGLTPDAYSYGALLQVLARSTQEPSEKASRASAILAAMEGAGLELNDFVKGLAAQCGVSIAL
jgi:pentatricopeptide repeat protein